MKVDELMVHVAKASDEFRKLYNKQVEIDDAALAVMALISSLETMPQWHNIGDYIKVHLASKEFTIVRKLSFGILEENRVQEMGAQYEKQRNS